MRIPGARTAIPAADSPAALPHFEASLRFETDCAEVHAARASGARGFVPLDVRRPALFAQAMCGARSIFRTAGSSRRNSRTMRRTRYS